MCNRILYSMGKRKTPPRCTCIAETPKGKQYHPALKTVYEREYGDVPGWKPTGFKCPVCGKMYSLEEVE